MVVVCQYPECRPNIAIDGGGMDVRGLEPGELDVCRCGSSPSNRAMWIAVRKCLEPWKELAMIWMKKRNYRV
jgi:hypothetical protein